MANLQHNGSHVCCHVSNACDVQEKTGELSIQEKSIQKKLQWLSHVQWIPNQHSLDPF